MLRSAQGMMAILLVSLVGCSFSENEEIGRPADSAEPTGSSTTTTSAVPTGVKPLPALPDGAQTKPGATVAVTTVKQLKAQLASTKTAVDLPTADGRYDLTGRIIVAPRQVIDGLVDDGRLTEAVTADVAFATAGGGKPAAKPAATTRSGSMLIPETGPVRLVVADSADCCGFALIRERDAYSVDVTTSSGDPTPLHVVAVSGVDPFSVARKNDAYVPPAATAKPIGKVAIPDMTVKLPTTKRPPGVTDPPANPDKRATLVLPPPVPAGSWCGYLAAHCVSFDEAVAIFNQLGRPGHMDADGNGIPCETRY